MGSGLRKEVTDVCAVRRCTQKEAVMLGTRTEGERKAPCMSLEKTDSVVCTERAGYKGQVCTGWFLCLPPPPRSSHTLRLGFLGLGTTGPAGGCRSPKPAPRKWPVINGLPVTDTLQSIVLSAKFLSTYCARKWEALPLKQGLCLTPLMNVYRHDPQSKEGGGFPFLLPSPIKLPAVRTHFLGPSGSS